MHERSIRNMEIMLREMKEDLQRLASQMKELSSKFS